MDLVRARKHGYGFLAPRLSNTRGFGGRESGAANAESPIVAVGRHAAASGVRPDQAAPTSVASAGGCHDVAAWWGVVATVLGP